MPNGGSDCCGTCWFNSVNHGHEGYTKTATEEQPYCQIRDVAIENPFWTYCANHPHRRPERDPIPIGPITRYAGDGWSNDREVWIPSPDTPEIRQHLIELLEAFFVHLSKDRYPIGPDIGVAIIRQLGEFKEKRAEKYIVWIAQNSPDTWADEARAAIDKIREDS